MTEAKALLAIARAQKALLILTRQNLRRDQTAGLSTAETAKKHSEIYWKIRDDWEDHGLISSEEADAADKTAGFNP